MTPGAPGHAVRAPAHAPDGVAQGSAAQGSAAQGSTFAEARMRPAVVRQFELTEKVHAYDPKADTALIDAAYVLAMKAHGAQKRDNGDPYITHPVAVADILAGYRLDTASIATGLLHDVIEDTSVKLPEITERFGKEIAGLVDGVTKLTRLELQSDRTKQAENFRKLVLAMSRDIRVLLVKLADRLHNMRTLHFVRRPGAAQAHRPRNDGDLRPARRADRHGRGEDRAADAGLRPARPRGLRHHPGPPELPARPGRRRDRGGARRAQARLRAVRREGGRGHRAGEVALLDLGEDAAAQRGVRAAFRHHGVPRRGAEQGGLLRRAWGDPFRLSGDRRAVQGLHLDAEIERLPVRCTPA